MNRGYRLTRGSTRLMEAPESERRWEVLRDVTGKASVRIAHAQAAVKESIYIFGGRHKNELNEMHAFETVT